MSKSSKRTQARDARRQCRLPAPGLVANTPANRLLNTISQRLQNPAYDGFAVYGVAWGLRKPVSADGSDRTFAHCG
jgi:hypothetical protein